MHKALMQGSLLNLTDDEVHRMPAGSRVSPHVRTDIARATAWPAVRAGYEARGRHREARPPGGERFVSSRPECGMGAL
jgi:hypothetical protein